MSSMKLLVVEDDPALGASLSRSLRFDGYSVELVDSGEQAMASMVNHGADCVILDVGLPGISGLELTRRVRPLRPAGLVSGAGRDG